MGWARPERTIRRASRPHAFLPFIGTYKSGRLSGQRPVDFFWEDGGLRRPRPAELVTARKTCGLWGPHAAFGVGMRLSAPAISPGVPACCFRCLHAAFGAVMLLSVRACGFRCRHAAFGVGNFSRGAGMRLSVRTCGVRRRHAAWGAGNFSRDAAMRLSAPSRCFRRRHAAFAADMLFSAPTIFPRCRHAAFGATAKVGSCFVGAALYARVRSVTRPVVHLVAALCAR